MKKMILMFLCFFTLAVSIPVGIHGWPWSVDSRIDLSAVATFLAVFVALGVAVRDGVMREIERRHQAARFFSYHRPAIELILKRVASANGVISQKKGLRLGAERPHDGFKFASLVVNKDIWIDLNFVLENLHNLPVGQAEKVSYALGLLPLLRSDFETLSTTNPDVAINERDQDLIKMIMDRSTLIIVALQEYLKLSDKDLDSLVSGYAEAISFNGEVYLVNGTI